MTQAERNEVLEEAALRLIDVFKDRLAKAYESDDDWTRNMYLDECIDFEEAVGIVRAMKTKEEPTNVDH